MKRCIIHCYAHNTNYYVEYDESSTIQLFKQIESLVLENFNNNCNIFDVAASKGIYPSNYKSWNEFDEVVLENITSLDYIKFKIELFKGTDDEWKKLVENGDQSKI